MANDLTGQVWRIDSSFSYNGPVKIVNLNWVEAVSQGDEFTLLTLANKLIFDAKAYASNYSNNFGWLGYFPSIKCTKIDSGLILISVGSGK